MNNDHKQRIIDFLHKCFYGFNVIGYTMQLCDDIDEERTSYFVKITNDTNDSKACVVLDSDGIDVGLEVGDDFETVDEIDFLGYLFVWQFVTLTED